MTPFCFEHTFTAPSPDVLIATYFDPEYQVEQDKALEIIEREVLELVETAEQIRRVCRVVPKRQLPAMLKPFSSGQLHYIETVTWQRSTNELKIETRPSLMKGRARIEATYRLEAVAPGSVRRRYEGQVSVDVALVANRVEAGIVAEFSRSMPITAACTQRWIDRHSSRSVPARA